MIYNSQGMLSVASGDYGKYKGAQKLLNYVLNLMEGSGDAIGNVGCRSFTILIILAISQAS